MHIVPRNTARELDSKRTKEGKQELLRAGQSLRVVCSQEGAYEALDEQRRDGVARNGIGCAFVPIAANGLQHIVHLALSIRTGSEFHCLLVYKISSRFYFTMAVVDMTSIHFYRPSPAVSPRPSLKSSLLCSADEKRNATLQRDR